jgi:hypothetical protein
MMDDASMMVHGSMDACMIMNIEKKPTKNVLFFFSPPPPG